MSDEDIPLPSLVHVDQSFNTRLPSQRVMDMLAKLESASISELIQTQTFRVVAFRALLRDFPNRDPASLWLHAYDTEVEVHDVDPTNGNGLTPSQPSVGTGA